VAASRANSDSSQLMVPAVPQFSSPVGVRGRGSGLGSRGISRRHTVPRCQPLNKLEWAREENTSNYDWNFMNVVKFIPAVSDSFVFLREIGNAGKSLQIAPEEANIDKIRGFVPVDNIAHCVSFIGPTHAGKSTLVRAIMASILLVHLTMAQRSVLLPVCFRHHLECVTFR